MLATCNSSDIGNIYNVGHLGSIGSIFTTSIDSINGHSGCIRNKVHWDARLDLSEASDRTLRCPGTPRDDEVSRPRVGDVRVKRSLSCGPRTSGCVLSASASSCRPSGSARGGDCGNGGAWLARPPGTPRVRQTRAQQPSASICVLRHRPLRSPRGGGDNLRLTLRASRPLGMELFFATARVARPARQTAPAVRRACRERK